MRGSPLTPLTMSAISTKTHNNTRKRVSERFVHKEIQREE
jgi:hypothetical protein